MKNKYCLLCGNTVHTVMPSEIPKIIYVEVTQKCNLQCIHCFNNSGPNHKLPKLVYFESVLRKVEQLNVKEIVLSGGEPFVHPNILEIINMFAEKYSVKILTNGTLLNKPIINYLIRKGIKTQITLNGPTKQIDAQMRGNGFDATVASIQEMVALGGIDLLYITTAISKLNYQSLEEYTKFLKSLGVKNIQFSMVNRRGRAVENWNELELTLPEKITALLEVEKIKQKYSDVNIITSGLSRMNDYLVDDARGDCEYYTEEVCFNVNGDISICPCIQLFCDCTKCNSIYLGQGESMTQFLESNSEKCRTCPVYSSCMAGCLNYVQLL